MTTTMDTKAGVEPRETFGQRPHGETLRLCGIGPKPQRNRDWGPRKLAVRTMRARRNPVAWGLVVVGVLATLAAIGAAAAVALWATGELARQRLALDAAHLSSISECAAGPLWRPIYPQMPRTNGGQ